MCTEIGELCQYYLFRSLWNNDLIWWSCEAVWFQCTLQSTNWCCRSIWNLHIHAQDTARIRYSETSIAPRWRYQLSNCMALVLLTIRRHEHFAHQPFWDLNVLHRWLMPRSLNDPDGCSASILSHTFCFPRESYLLNVGENRYGVFVYKDSEAKAREVSCRTRIDRARDLMFLLEM